MSRRFVTVMSRVAFIACGLVSLVTAVPFVILRGAELPVESEWVMFVIALDLAGGFSLVIGLLPRSWTARMCRRDRDDASLLSLPLRVLAIFAAGAYLIAVGVYYAPHTWSLNPQLMLALCPLYFVKMAIDPSHLAIFFMLAPMNAAVYGALGVAVAFAWMAFRKQR